MANNNKYLINENKNLLKELGSYHSEVGQAIAP